MTYYYHHLQIFRSGKTTTFRSRSIGVGVI